MTRFLLLRIYNVNKAGEQMVVYADILILVNFVVDYFLLSLSARFLQKKPRLLRLLSGALLGGIFSLYIFLPQSNALLQTAAQIIMCTALCFVTFGFENIKSFFRSAAVLFCVNFAYSGAMIALWIAFKPYGMVINNSVVYFNISPLFLILFSVTGYFGVVLFRKIFKRPFAPNTYCDVTVFCKENSLKLSGIVDTGNSLVDVFGISQIFITDEQIIDALLGKYKEEPVIQRKIPCSTVTGQSLLDGYRIDRAEVSFNNKKFSFKNPLLAVSDIPLDDCKIIVNPENLN